MFLAFGGVGLMWSVIGYAALPEAAKRPWCRRATAGGGVESPSAAGSLEEASSEEASSERSGAASDPSTAPPVPPAGWFDLPRWMYPQLASLAWCHVCINWGFFILQSWLPVYLASELGFSLGGSARRLGVALLFSPPHLASAGGQVADRMIARGTEHGDCPSTDDERRHRRAVRAFAGSRLPAAQSPVAPPSRASPPCSARKPFPSRGTIPTSKMFFRRARGVPGHHQHAGRGERGSSPTLTGYMVGHPRRKFSMVFLVTAGVYASSGLVWNANMRGRVMFP